MSGLPPLVTIAVPFYNPGSFIIDTLNSVYAQSYQQIELILYDDASTDHSQDLVVNWISERHERFSNVFFLEGKINKGVGHACDAMLKKSSGVYFQMLGADDLIYPEKISRQVYILEKNLNYCMIYGNMDRINESGEKISADYFNWQNFSAFGKGEPATGHIFSLLVRENFIPASSVLVRRKVIEEVGGYDVKLKSEDWDLWLRIARKFAICGEKKIVGGYRILPSSAMHSSKNKIHVLESLNEALIKHKGFTKATDALIKANLYINTMEMYRLGYISKKWAAKLFSYKRGLKPLVYQLLMSAGIKVNQKRLV